MTTADTPPAVPVPERGPFELDDTYIRFGPLGTIVVTMDDGKPITLPRPTFGQIRPLILAQGQVSDDARTAQTRANLGRATVQAKLESHPEWDGKQVPTTATSIDFLLEIRDESRAIATAIDDTMSTVLGGWWTLVFETLEMHQVTEKDWPSWFMDPTLPQRMVDHWRFVPVGPG